jgi:hypothetical protein
MSLSKDEEKGLPEMIVLVGKPEGKGAPGRPRRVLDHNIKTYL